MNCKSCSSNDMYFSAADGMALLHSPVGLHHDSPIRARQTTHTPAILVSLGLLGHLTAGDFFLLWPHSKLTAVTVSK